MEVILQVYPIAKFMGPTWDPPKVVIKLILKNEILSTSYEIGLR